LFFSEQFKIVHDAYQALLEHIGFGFAQLIREKDFFLPIVHAESDFKSPLFVGDLIEIQVRVEKVGKTSFILSYQLLDTSGGVIGTAQTVHVAMDKTTQKKTPLPLDLRGKIEDLHKDDCN